MDSKIKIKSIYIEFLLRHAQLINPELKLISYTGLVSSERYACFIGHGLRVEPWDDIYLKYGIFADNHNNAKAKG